MIYVISDQHYFHDKEFIYASRGFNSIEEMNKTLAENHNNTISAEDTVYFLGDELLGEINQDKLNFLKSLNGKKYLAIGNHTTDKKIQSYLDNNIFEDIQYGYRIKYRKKIFLLTHYPTIVTNTTNDKVYNIHGHTHNINIFNDDMPLNINVSVDALPDYKPISLEELYEKSRSR